MFITLSSLKPYSILDDYINLKIDKTLIRGGKLNFIFETNVRLCTRKRLIRIDRVRIGRRLNRILILKNNSYAV